MTAFHSIFLSTDAAAKRLISGKRRAAIIRWIRDMP
jgi:hypothetical protein